MNVLRQCMLSAYYVATLPARGRASARRWDTSTEPVRILFYHRVADEKPNPWTISTKGFAAQMTWLRRRFEIVSLHEAQQRIASGHNHLPTACITFDDGYADNLQTAIPLLVRYQMPFTYFVSTRYVLEQEPFPHDVAAGVPLAPNTPAQLSEIVAAGGEIGAHTRTHADLGKWLPDERLEAEIVGSRDDLEALVCEPVRYFAFPFGLPGNMSERAFACCYRAGYRGVCSAYGGYNFPGDDAFHIRRFHADPQMIRFKNWMTIDPRKLRDADPFDPGAFRAHSADVPSAEDHTDQDQSAQYGVAAR
jgi:peptidoglycan/xylan/chitin deacetylase (PgdA/CDA1 family)